MAENVHPGFGGGLCYEIDLLEANRNAMQTAIHTQLGGAIGSGQCDRNGYTWPAINRGRRACDAAMRRGKVP